MQLVCWLQLENPKYSFNEPDITSSFRRYQSKGLSAPDTGGRIIINAQRAPAQILHTDNTFTADEEIAENGSSELPPYFCIVSYNESVPLYVLEGSHRYLSFAEKSMKSIAKHIPHRLIFIPPWSVVVIRGDVLHAGGGYAE